MISCFWDFFKQPSNLGLESGVGGFKILARQEVSHIPWKWTQKWCWLYWSPPYITTFFIFTSFSWNKMPWAKIFGWPVIALVLLKPRSSSSSSVWSSSSSSSLAVLSGGDWKFYVVGWFSTWPWPQTPNFDQNFFGTISSNFSLKDFLQYFSGQISKIFFIFVFFLQLIYG